MATAATNVHAVSRATVRAVRRLVLRHGVGETARRLGVSRATVARLTDGSPSIARVLIAVEYALDREGAR